LEAVKEGGAEVRPHFRCRLAGTLADIIARAEQEKPASRSKEDRRGEIVELQRFAFEVTFHAPFCRGSASELLFLHGPDMAVHYR
jgi:hypothetical protein